MKKILLITAGIVFGAIIFFLIKLSQFYGNIYIPKLNNGHIQQDKTSYNILFLGYGGPGHDGPYLTDTMMVVHLDLKSNKVFQISIPRDAWVKIPTQSGQSLHSKVNTLYEIVLFLKDFPDVQQIIPTPQGKTNPLTYGVWEVTGLPIDYYVAIDFSGFVRAVDILGGVDINVQKSFDDLQYPVEGKEKDLCGKTEADLPELEKIATESPQLAFPCRYEHLHFDEGLQHMDGTAALKFVRSRHSAQDGGDFARAQRQQLFLEGVKEKVLNIGFVPKIIPLLDELKEHIKTDIPFDLTKRFVGEVKDANSYEITHLVLSDKDYLDNALSENGQYVLIPKEGQDNWNNIHQVIINAIEGVRPNQKKK